jgi:hypothetical protein
MCRGRSSACSRTSDVRERSPRVETRPQCVVDGIRADASPDVDRAGVGRNADRGTSLNAGKRANVDVRRRRSTAAQHTDADRERFDEPRSRRLVGHVDVTLISQCPRARSRRRRPTPDEHRRHECSDENDAEDRTNDETNRARDDPLRSVGGRSVVRRHGTRSVPSPAHSSCTQGDTDRPKDRNHPDRVTQIPPLERRIAQVLARNHVLMEGSSS